MGAVADIVALLDKIPMWKRLTALPDQIAALEKRIQALEEGQTLPTDKCLVCNGPLKITGEARHPQRGALGFKQIEYYCKTCDTFIARDWHPKKGFC